MAEQPKSGRLALIEELRVDCIALNAAITGTTDDAVLRWLAAGVTITGPYISAPDVAADGTVFTVSTPGQFYAEMMLPQLASTTILAGISQGGAIGTFTVNPAIGAGGVIATAGPNTLPAATTIGLYLGKAITIRDTHLGGLGAALRFLCTNGAGATPGAALTAAGCWASITRLVDKAA